MKQFNMYFSICVALLLAGVIWLTLDFPARVHEERFGPAFYPLTLVCVIAVLLVLFLLENRGTSEISPLFQGGRMRRPLFLAGAFAALIVLLEPLGFPLCGFVFLLVSMRFMGTSTRLSLMVASGVTASIYVMFRLVLSVPIPMGTLWETLS